MERLSKEECYRFLEFIEESKRDYKLDEMQAKLLWNLEVINEDMDQVKKDYKQILDRVGKKDNNYYARVCLLINSMNSFKVSNLKFEVKLETFYNYYLKLENVKYDSRMNNSKIENITTIVPIEINYNMFYWNEGIGKENNKEQLNKIRDEGIRLLEADEIDFGFIREWLIKLEMCMAITYGRWSKEYEEYLKNPFRRWLSLSSMSVADKRHDGYKKGLKEILNSGLLLY